MKKINLIGLLLLSVLLNPKVSNAQIVIGPSNYVNGGGGTGPLHCIGDGTAALPCYTGSTVNSGVYFSTTSTLISVNGLLNYSFTNNLFEQYNGTNAQRYNLYATRTDASNNELLVIQGQAGDTFQIYATKNGSGTYRNLELGAGGAVEWVINTSGNLVAKTGGTYNFGASGSAGFKSFYGGPQGIATTSTDGGVLENYTAATGGTPVQISPRLRFRGTAWDTAASETVDFFIENLPATAATPTGSLKFGYSLNGAAASYPLILDSTGTATFLNNALIGGDARVASTADFYWNGRSHLASTADGRTRFTNAAGTSGLIIDYASDALMAIITRGGSDAATATVHTLNLTTAGASMNIAATLQASLGTPSNGTIIYCSDCTIANPCAGGGTGAFAKRLNGVWVCN